MAIAPLNGRPALTHVALGTVYVTLRHNHDPRPLAAHTSAAAMSTTADWLAVVSLLGMLAPRCPLARCDAPGNQAVDRR